MGTKILDKYTYKELASYDFIMPLSKGDTIELSAHIWIVVEKRYSSTCNCILLFVK